MLSVTAVKILKKLAKAKLTLQEAERVREMKQFKIQGRDYYSSQPNDKTDEHITHNSLHVLHEHMHVLHNIAHTLHSN